LLGGRSKSVSKEAAFQAIKGTEMKNIEDILISYEEKVVSPVRYQQ
jgi:hypothetical protein